MYHSLTIGGKNTWDDWHLVPDSRPVMNPPKPRTEYVTIPGLDGSFDFTEAFGDVLYENREGSWKFYVMNDYGQKNYDYNAWYELYSAILCHIHGMNVLVYSEDDPKYVYRGRVSVNEWASVKDYSQITLDYSLEPYKYRAKINDDGSIEIDTTYSTARNDWKWDDLFDNEIIYGKFKVNGHRARVFYNKNEETIRPALRCTSKMGVYEFDPSNTKDHHKGKKLSSLRAGRNYDPGIILQTGISTFVFEGNGTVTVDYDREGTIL